MTTTYRSEYAGVVALPVRRAFEALTRRLAKLADRTTVLESRVTDAGTEANTTDASGDVSVTFGVTFDAAPTVTVSNSDVTLGHVPVVGTVTTTGATVRVVDFAGAAVASTATQFNWIAVGTV